MWKSAGRAPSFWVLPWHLPYIWGKSTEKPQSGSENLSQVKKSLRVKNLSQSRKTSVSVENPQSPAYMVSCHLDTEARVRSQVSLCGVFGGRSGTGTGFSPRTSVFPCQYHSTNAPYPFIHLPPMLYNVSLQVLQFSPVSTIPPMFHTHSFTYHPHYMMFLSQYFSFPLSVPFHQCSIPIHSLTTHAI